MGDPQQHCPVCAETPTVLVVMSHSKVRDLTVELLEREHGCWLVQALDERGDLGRVLAEGRPDLVVMDVPDFARCCRDVLEGFPPERVVVVGPEPDPAYERAARRAGAGAWLSRDCLAENLGAGMRAALGCSHTPCPKPREQMLGRRPHTAPASQEEHEDG